MLRRSCWALSLYSCILLSTATAQWKPLDPAQAALKAPLIDPKADAEVLLWEVRIEDTAQSGDVWATFDHFLRIKVFTEKGAKDQATVEIPLFGKTTLSHFSARTIQPDGSIAEVAKDAIKETDVVKGRRGRRGIKTRSFAFPGVKPGSILEYKYREVRMGQLATRLQLEFSRDLPIHEVRYLIKPIQADWMPYTMRVMDFHVQRTPFEWVPVGAIRYAQTIAKNVPAFKEEPHMPPENDVRPWIFIYYEKDRKLTPDKFWKETGREVYEELAKEVKVDGQAKKLAAELTSALGSPEEKAVAILNFCRVKVRNVNGPEVSAKEREQFKPNRTTSETLKQMMGTGGDKQAVFVALGKAAGLDARFVLGADRGWQFTNQNMMSLSFLRARSVAVKVGSGWKFYDPALRLSPPGMLRWQEEQAMALIVDSKEPEVVSTPLSDADKSVATRLADLQIDEKGGLDGTFRIGYTGHLATVRRTDLFDDTPEERIEKAKEEFANRYPGAELSDLKVENVDDPDKPLVYAAKIRLENYAQRTGKRLFLQPSFFTVGAAPRFPESQRQYDIHFEFPWTESDRVSLDLPEGYELDTPVAPGSAEFGGTGGYQTSMSKSGDGKRLIYTRQLTFGKEGHVYYPAKGYPAVKKVFDFIHEQDGHTMTLRAAN